MRAFFVVFLTAAPAFAQMLDRHGFHPRAMGMGGVQAASESDAAAAFHNPALLREGSLAIGFDWTRPAFSLTQTAGDASEMPDVRLPPDYAAVTAGASVPLKGVIAGRAALGFVLSAPARQLFRSRLIDDRTPYFYRYDDLPGRFQILLGAGVHPADWLSIGLGVQHASSYAGEGNFEAVLGSKETGPGRVVRREIGNELSGVAAATAGLKVGPFGPARFYGSWRSELKSSYRLPISVELGELGPLSARLDGVLHYSPQVLSVGAAAELLDGRLLVAADVGYERWSAAPTPVVNIEIEAPEAQTFGRHPLMVSQPLDLRFSDVVVPRLGIEWAPSDAWRVRGGYAYRPSMVPDHGPRTSYLDASAYIGSVGASFRRDDPLRIARVLELSAAVQLTSLVPREAQFNRVTYRYQGFVFDLCAAARYAW